ncbi:MAG: MATE family efflux transporter, partial [Clostridia bacterium]|nr:MATE family efflux transporter [Clostridia bacterium]
GAPYFLSGIMDMYIGYLRGLGHSGRTTVNSFIGVCGFRIGWIYTIFQLPQFHTPEWLYHSYTISWGITFVAQTIAYFIIYN